MGAGDQKDQAEARCWEGRGAGIGHARVMKTSSKLPGCGAHEASTSERGHQQPQGATPQLHRDRSFCVPERSGPHMVYGFT